MSQSTLITSCVAAALFLMLLFFFAISISVRYRKRKMEQAQRETEFAQTLLETRLEIQEQTLRHIGRELHDNLGQVASLIKINLNTLDKKDPLVLEQKLEDTRELLRQLIRDIKSLSQSLGSDRLSKAGLWAALEEELQRIRNTGFCDTALETTAGLPYIDADTQLILYRMSQEILNNALKHSQAKKISVRINYKENDITLAFEDDGIGFDTGAESNKGSGLTNLQHRAGLINARLDMASILGSGTRITIRLSTKN